MGGALCSCSDDEWIFRGKVITAAQWTAACPSCLQPCYLADEDGVVNPV